jgi:hypothetical protein
MSRTTQPLLDLFGGRTLRFSDLERASPDVSQKVLAQQLRQLERDSIPAASIAAAPSFSDARVIRVVGGEQPDPGRAVEGPGSERARPPTCQSERVATPAVTS